MIEVVYHRQYRRLTVKGHANSGEAGRDLVCAGVSTLVYTLAANIGHLQDCGQARIENMVVEEGNAEIQVQPVRKYAALVDSIIQAVCVGFELLAFNRPEYVSYQIMG